MILIIVVFGTAMMILGNVSRSAPSLQKVKRQAVLRDALLRAEHSSSRTDSIFMTNDMEVHREFRSYPGMPEISSVRLYILGGEKKDTLDFVEKIVEK